MRRLKYFSASCFILALALFGLGGPLAGAEDLWPSLSQASRAIGGGEKDAAVIVGAENYFAVAKVPGAVRNADDWQAYLTDTLQVPSDRVALLRDNEATLEKMRRFAAKEAAAVQPGGTLWFIFIGHGAPSKDGKDGLLVGIDAQQDADGLYERSLGRSELLGLLNKGEQAKTVVLLDACFSGKSPSGETLAAGLQPLVLARTQPEIFDGRTILLTAAKSDQFAGPLPKAAQMRPAFSYLALGALRGWAADAEGKVRASALVDFARRALLLDKGRTQTPELTVGAPEAVLGVGHERAPDLAKIDREGGAAGPDFRVADLPAVPRAQAPKALGQSPSGLDLGSVDVDALGRYDEASSFDKGGASPEDKAEKWRALAKEARFADMAAKRADEWDGYAAQKKVEDEARLKRLDARDADWDKLSRLLAFNVVSEASKRSWSGQFAAAYMDSPGLQPAMAKALAPHLPAGETKEALEELAKSPPKEEAALGKAGIQWVRIPGGTFSMGSGNRDDEGPVHGVTMKSFQMAKTLVTNKQYKACVEAGACTPAVGIHRGFQGDDQPVLHVDWNQAKTFSEWVGGRLPTEAEWEYAARSAGKDYVYPWGNEEATCERAVIDQGSAGCGRFTTWPVCSKPAGNTEQGLCDMAGNTWEWVQDWYHGSYKRAPTDGSAWEKPTGSERIIRGGSWGLDAGFARAAYRSNRRAPGDHSGDDLGFRPAR